MAGTAHGPAGGGVTLRVEITATLGAFPLRAGFTVAPGITALFGPSGAGKTSLINAIAGLLRPAAGRIIIGDRVLFDADARIHLPPHQRRIGYVFQDARLFPHMSVARNLTYGGRHDVDRITDMLGLRDLLDRRPARLSGGERQRVALGRALMRNPNILLMDEPLAALDSARKSEILPYLERLRDARDIPILYVTHAMAEVTRLADAMVVMNGGAVVAKGALSDVLGDMAAAPFLGVRGAGTVLTCKVTGLDMVNGLTSVRFSGGTILLSGRVGGIGQAMRLNIAAQDIILSREKPVGLSALNILPVTIISLDHGPQPGLNVRLQAGDATLWARVTQRSATALQLAAGQQIYAIIKATAVAGEFA